MKSKRHCTHGLGLAALVTLFLMACGAPTSSSTLSEGTYESSLQSGSTDTKALSNWRDYPALSMISEWQTLNSTSIELDIGVRWLGFGAEVQAASFFRISTMGSVDLVKHITSPESRIMKDNEGHISISEDEPVSARCQYQSHATLRLDGSGRFSLSGVTVRHERGEAKVLEVQTTGKTFDVQDGQTLDDLESYCRQDFETVMRPIVERDLAMGIKSKLRLEELSDSRVNALRLVLKNQVASMIHQGEQWISDPVSVEAEGSYVHIKGNVRRPGIWHGQDYSFHYIFEKTTKKIEKVDISPRGVDDESRAALELSLFMARNAANWSVATVEGRSFTIDTSALPHP